MVSIEGHEFKIFDLMQRDGEAFVNESYALLLGRAPDSEGFMYYMWRLSSGISKRRIILQLLKSPEAVAMKEENPSLSREIDEWRKKTASIKYKLKYLSNFREKKKSVFNSIDNTQRFIGQLNDISKNQAIMNAEIAALRADLSNKVDTKPAHIENNHQMSRQARYVYTSLLQYRADAESYANSN